MLIEKNKRKDIQALRGLAVLLVVIFHAKESWLPNGYLGVDIFYVISGFVMAPLIKKIRNSDSIFMGLKMFYRRRFLRLAPALGFMFIISLPIIAFFGNLTDLQRISKQGFFSFLLLGNLGAHMFASNYFAVNQNAFIHLWSLSVEEQFYFISPLIFLLFSIFKFKPNKRIILLVFTFSMILLSIFIDLYKLSDSLIISKTFGFYSPLLRSWEFGLGIIVYLYQHKITSLISSNYLKILYFFWLVDLILIMSPLKFTFRIGAVLGSVFAAISLIVFHKNNSRSLNVLAFIGERSYSIYLFHMPFIYLAKYSPQSGDSPTKRYMVLIISLFSTFLISEISYRYVENYFRIGYAKESSSVIKNVISIYITIPIILLGILFWSSQNSFFGYTKAQNPPKVSWSLDFQCNVKVDGNCTEMYSKKNRTVVLLGDSHALQYRSVIREISADSSWNFFMLGSTYAREKHVSSDLPREGVYRLSQKVVIDVLLISNFYPPELNKEDIERNLTALSKLANKIVIIGQNPVFPDGASYFKGSFASQIKFNLPKRSFLLHEMNQGAIIAGKQWEQIAKKKNIDFIDTFSKFCNYENCIRYEKGNWLYFDDDHLSIAGTQFFKNDFLKILKKF